MYAFSCHFENNQKLEDKMCKLGKVGLDWIDRSRQTGLIDAQCLLLEGQCFEVRTVSVLILKPRRSEAQSHRRTRK